MLRTILTTASVMAFAAVSANAAEPLISAEELNGMLGSDNLAILDVRSDIENKDHDAFAKMHIPGAVDANYKKSAWRVDRGEIHYMLPEPSAMEEKLRAMGVDNDDHVVIVAAGESPKALDLGAATRIYWSLKAMGHENVSILDGGMKAWTEAGFDTTGKAMKAEMGDFTANPDMSIFADGDMVAAAIEGPVELIDSRPTPHFAADAQPGYARNPGTIQSAVNLPAPSLVGKGGTGWAALDDVSARLEALGVAEGEKTIAFCNTGHHASVVWFVASELLGRDVALYDGSIYDWTQVRMGPTVIGKNPATN